MSGVITHKTEATRLVSARTPVTFTQSLRFGKGCSCGVGGKCQDNDNGRFEELYEEVVVDA